MKIAVNQKDRCLKILLTGDLDHHGAKGLMNQLEREIELALPLSVVLDFQGVPFMDSSGIAVVMRVYQRMRELGGSVRLRQIATQPRKVFEAAGISRLVEME